MLDKLEDGVYNIKIQNDVAFVTTFKTAWSKKMEVSQRLNTVVCWVSLSDYSKGICYVGGGVDQLYELCVLIFFNKSSMFSFKKDN